MLSQQLNQEVVDLATEITSDAVRYFEKAVEQSGLVLTAELRNSFRYQIVQQAGRLAVSGDIFFTGYGRLKDMRLLTYSTNPPVEALEQYVESVGLGKFAWVDRWGRKQVPTTQSDARHIAWAIAMNIKKVGTIQRKRKNSWYNRTKTDFVNVMRRRMLDRTKELVLRAMKEQLEN